MDNRPIGVFDSGLGGLSVLASLEALMPRERFIYYGDTKNAPYGTKPEPEILALTLEVARHLVDQNVKALVIACNTMTSAAAATLRARYAMPIVGMEPALKPASAARKGGLVLVLATSATLRQEKFLALMAKYGEGAVPLPCPGLMEFAERGALDTPELHAYLTRRFAPYQGQVIDAAVLGCTHYLFLRDAIAAHLPGTQLFDGNDGAAHHLQTLLEARDALTDAPQGGIVFQSSDESALPGMRALYKAYTVRQFNCADSSQNYEISSKPFSNQTLSDTI